MAAPVPYTNGFTATVTSTNQTIVATYGGCHARSSSSPMPVGYVWGSETTPINTNSDCAVYCFGLNHAFSASFNNECACADSAPADTAALDTACNEPCPNDTPHACGSSDGTMYTVYSSVAQNATAPAVNSTSFNSNSTTTSNATVVIVSNSTTASNTTIPPSNQTVTNVPHWNHTWNHSNWNNSNWNMTWNNTVWNTSVPDTSANVSVSASVSASASASASASDSASASSTSTSSSASASASSPSNPITPNPKDTPTQVQGQKWSYFGCWGEPAVGRALGTKALVSDGTITGCLQAASAAGATWAGLEYGGECWATTIDKPYGGQIPESYCNMPCAGDASGNTICGSGNVLSMFSATATSSGPVQEHAKQEATGTRVWTYQSCWGEPAVGRALSQRIIANKATMQECTDLAASMGLPYAGLEYGGECWAAATIYGGQIPESYCSQACDANPAQICGAGNVLSLYVSNPLPKNTLSVSGATWKYTGCWGEPAKGRAMPVPFSNQAWNQGTVESCLAAGKAAGMSHCGLEYGSECWCSQSPPYGGQIPESYCNMPCKNNKAEMCGGGNTLNLYALQY